MYQGNSFRTVATANSSDNDNSVLEEDSSRQTLEKNRLSEMRKKERDAQLRTNHPKGVWTNDEGAISDPESANNRPMNLSTDATTADSSLGPSVQDFGELASDGKKEPHDDDNPKTICGFTKKRFCFIVVAMILTTLMVASIPTVIMTAKEEIVTQAPSVSMVPSTTPSLSLVPSDRPSMVPTSTFVPSDLPSTVPSMVPSNAPTTTYKPSQRPSNVPSLSLVPSIEPTNSMVPSLQPSSVPTNTQQPSLSPTKLPSVNPSVSMEPTFTPIDPNWRFKLRLYWSKDYFWQEETEERFWCLECVPCAEYGRVSVLRIVQLNEI